MRAKIMAAAAELGYRPNAIAQGLITRRSNMVAVVISNLTNLHYPEVLSALTQRLSDRGVRVLLFSLARESQIDEVIEQIWRYRVDGAIVAARLSREQAAAFDEAGIPLVLYNRQIDDAPVSSVMCESGLGEAMLVDNMVRAGLRSFGIIAGPSDSTVGEARVAAAISRLAQAGVDDVPLLRGDYSYESGHRAALALLDADRLDAIIAANDVMALGAMDAARHGRGMRIPDDLSVVGFDGVAPARWESYDLTTVRQPVERMTEAAVAMLIERIEDSGTGPERRLFSGDLVTGNTARFR